MRLMSVNTCRYLMLLPIASCFLITLQLSSFFPRNTHDSFRTSLPSSSTTTSLSPSTISYAQHRRFLSSNSGQQEFLDVESKEKSPESKRDDDDSSTKIGFSLIDASLETGDPRWKDARIPFCTGSEYIDCKLAFMVDMEGQSYGIGVPFDDAVDIVIQEPDENNDGKFKIKHIKPESYDDNKEYAELMEIFAVQVQEQLGKDLRLRKTPKVLTISGGLAEITENWQNMVIPQPFEVEDILEAANHEKDKDDENNDLNFFYEFMKNELGDKEFDKTLNHKRDEIETELGELIGYFDVPNLQGTGKKNLEGLEELLESMANDIEKGKLSGMEEFMPDTENNALKLLGYMFTESKKSYFLVKPLQPYTLIGRHVKDEEDIIRFDLLDSEEEKIIIPKLERICQEELKANGLTFSNVQK